MANLDSSNKKWASMSNDQKKSVQDALSRVRGNGGGNETPQQALQRIASQGYYTPKSAFEINTNPFTEERNENAGTAFNDYLKQRQAALDRARQQSVTDFVRNVNKGQQAYNDVRNILQQNQERKRQEAEQQARTDAVNRLLQSGAFETRKEADDYVDNSQRMYKLGGTRKHKEYNEYNLSDSYYRAKYLADKQDWTPEEEAEVREIYDAINGDKYNMVTNTTPGGERLAGLVADDPSWRNVYQTMDARLHPIRESTAYGFAHGTGANSIAGVIGGQTDEYNKRVAPIAAQHPIATRVGALAGSQVLMYTLGPIAAVATGAAQSAGLVGGVNTIGGIGKVASSIAGARALNTAFLFGATDAIYNADKLAKGKISGGQYVKGVTTSAAGGALGSIAAGLVYSGIGEVLRKSHNMNSEFGKWLAVTMGSAARSGTDLAVNQGVAYATDDDEMKMTPQQIAMRLATTFLYSQIDYAMNSASMNMQAKQKLQRDIIDLYEGYDNLAQRNYGSEEEFLSAYNKLKTGTQRFRNELNSQYLPGQQEYVDSANEKIDALEQILDAAKARFDAGDPYFDMGKMLTENIGGVPSAGASTSGPSDPAVDEMLNNLMSSMSGNAFNQDTSQGWTPDMMRDAMQAAPAVTPSFPAAVSTSNTMPTTQPSIAELNDQVNSPFAIYDASNDNGTYLDPEVATLAESGAFNSMPTPEGFEALPEEETNNVLMNLAQQRESIKEQQRQALYDAGKNQEQNIQPLMESATMLSQEEKLAAIRQGNADAAQAEIEMIRQENLPLESAKENLNVRAEETGTVVQRAGSERNLEISSGERVGRVSQGTGVSQETSRNLAGAAADNESKNLRFAKADSAETILPGAKPGQVIYRIEEGTTTAIQKAEAQLKAYGVQNSIAFASEKPIEVGSGEKARAYVEPNSRTIGYRVNDERAESDKLVRHELVELGIIDQKIDKQETYDYISNHVDGGSEEAKDLLDLIVQLYSKPDKLYDPSTTVQERKRLMESGIKEMLCDAGAGINQFAGYDEYEDIAYAMDEIIKVAQPFLNEKLGGVFDAEPEQANVPNPIETYSEQNNTKAVQYSVDQFSQANGYKLVRNSEGIPYSIVDPATGKEIRPRDITPEKVKNTPQGMMIATAEKTGIIDAKTADAQRRFTSDLMKMIVKYKDQATIWEISGANAFSSFKANSDSQYGSTVDFGTICAKTQGIVDVMSRAMVEKGRGLTRDEVLKVYDATAKTGLSVPCPVCYVFSRWVGVPSLLETMRKGQERFGENTTAEAVNAYIQRMEKTYNGKDGINKAKVNVQKKVQKLQSDLLKARGDNKKIGEIAKAAKEVEKELTDLEIYNWVTQVRCKTDSKRNPIRDKNGLVSLDPKYKSVPNEVLLDLNRTGEFAQEYPKQWLFRTTRGAGMGKAILPYSGAGLGDAIRGAGIAKPGQYAKGQNPFFHENVKKAERDLLNAIRRMKAQNLIGGQRLQSTSDFRAEWGLDYIVDLMEMQNVGAKGQLYTKVIEAVDLYASAGNEVNLSIMGKGNGYHLDSKGKPVLGIEDFSSVTGIDFRAAYEKVKQYDNVQMILVGLNDTHVRLALADKRIGFVIPWHASGSSEDVLRTLMDSNNEKLINGSDYTPVQDEKVIDYGDKAVNAEKKAMRDLRKDIVMGKLKKGVSTDQQALLNKNEWLQDLYNRYYVDKNAEEYGVRLSGKQAEKIFPYEYWDKSLTLKDADQNGYRFQDYCESLGLKPRFSGAVIDGKEIGNFANDPGYWKLLIDRSMYNNDGTYHEPKVIDVTKVKINQIPMTVNSNLYRDDSKLKQATMDSLRAIDQRPNDTSVSYDISDSGIDEDAVQIETEREFRAQAVTNESVEAMLQNGYSKKEAAEAVEAGGHVEYSTRLELPPRKTITAYKAFYAMDGKLYPPMVANDVDVEQNKGIKKVSGTLKGLETPVGVWIDADVGRLAYGEDGKPLRNTKGRLAVKNDKGGGTLAFRPGWHLGLWPDAKQFNVKDPITGELKACMPDGLVFARCSVAADYDYQLEALGYGMKENGKFDRTQAGLPRIPKNGYYMYRTNVDPTTAPWIITGAIKVEEILDDDMSAEICAKYGITADPRASHKKINLADYGLKAGPVTPTEDMDRFLPNDAVKSNAEALEAALSDPDYADAYVARSVNFDDPEIIKELARNKQNAAFYKEAQAKYGNKSYAVNNPNDPLIDKETFAYSSQLNLDTAILDDTFPDWEEAFNAPLGDVMDVSESRQRFMQSLADSNDTVKALNVALGRSLDNKLTVSADASKVANSIVKKYRSGTDADKVSSDIEKLYESLGDAAKDSVNKIATAAADIGAEILDGIKTTDKTMQDSYPNLKKELKSYKLAMSDQDKSDVGSAYDGFNNFRKKMFGKLTLVKQDTKGAVPVDTAYQELSEKYPDLFPDDIIAPSEQMVRMAEVANSLKATKVHAVDGMDEYDYEMQAYVIGQEILKDYYTAAGETGYGKVFDAELAKVRQKYEKQIQRLKASNNAKVDRVKQKYEDRIAKANARRKLTKTGNDLLKEFRKLKKMKGGPEFEAAKQALIGEFDLYSKGMRDDTKLKLEKLRDEAEALKEKDVNYANSNYDKDFKTFSRLNQKHIKDLSLDEMEELIEAAVELRHAQEIQNKVLKDNKRISAATIARRGIEQQRKAKSLNKNNELGSLTYRMFRGIEGYNFQSLSAVRALRAMDGYRENGVLSGIGKDLNDGYIRSVDFEMKARKSFEEFTNDKKFMDSLSKPTVEITNPADGKTAMITPGMRMAVYLMSKDPDNRNHIKSGGLCIPNVKLYTQRAGKEAYADDVRFRLEYTDLQDIYSGMTDREKAFADRIFQFYNGGKDVLITTKDAMNETSMLLNGHEIAFSDNHYPINTNKNFIQGGAKDKYQNPTIEGGGFLKERKVNASNPIYLEDATDVLNRSINNVKNYYGLAVPIRNANAILNFTESGFDTSLRQEIDKAWKGFGLKIIDNIIDDLNAGGRRHGVEPGKLDKFQSRYVTSVFGANAGVAMKQFSSYLMALAYLHPDSMLKGLNLANRVDLDYIDSITPLHWARRKGMSGTELGEVYDYRQGVTGKLEKGANRLTNGITHVDVFTTKRLISASIAEMKKYHPEFKEGTPEYDAKLAELINNVFQLTQPSYDVLHRSEYQRSTGDFARIMSMFSTASLNMSGEVADAFGEFRAKMDQAKTGEGTKADARRAASRWAKVLNAYILAQVSYTAIGALWNLALHKGKNYRDEKGEITAESFIKRVGTDAIENIIGGGFFGGKQVVGIATLNWDDMVLPGLSTFNSTMNDITDFIEQFGNVLTGKETDTSKLKKVSFHLARDLGAVGLGLPINTFYNFANAGKLWIDDIKNGKLGTWDAGEGLFGLSDTSVNKKEYAQQALSAIEDGNQEKADYALQNTGKDQLEEALGAESQKKEDGKTIKDSKRMDALKKIDEMNINDTDKAKLASRMYDFEGVNGDNWKEYINTLEAKMNGKQEGVIEYLSTADISEEERRNLWENACGYSPKTYEKNFGGGETEAETEAETEPETEAEIPVETKPETETETVPETEPETEAVKPSGSGAEIESEITEGSIEGDARYAYIVDAVQNKKHSAEEAVAWYNSDPKRVNAGKYIAWTNAGGSTYDYIKTRSDLSKFKGNGKQEKIANYILNQGYSEEKQRVIWFDICDYSEKNWNKYFNSNRSWQDAGAYLNQRKRQVWYGKPGEVEVKKGDPLGKLEGLRSHIKEQASTVAAMAAMAAPDRETRANIIAKHFEKNVTGFNLQDIFDMQEHNFPSKVVYAAFKKLPARTQYAYIMENWPRWAVKEYEEGYESDARDFTRPNANELREFIDKRWKLFEAY